MPGLTQARDSGEPGCPAGGEEEGVEKSVSFQSPCPGEEGKSRLVQRAASSFPNRHLPLRPPERAGIRTLPSPHTPWSSLVPLGDRTTREKERARTGSPQALLRLGEPRCAPAAPAPARGGVGETISSAAKGGDEAGPRGGAAYPGPDSTASGEARFSKWMKFRFFFFF